MSRMIHQETNFLLVSLLWGVGLTMAYDVLRILRKAVRHAYAVVAAEDFLYWIFAAFALFVLLFSMNDGNLRWYALAGAGAGMWLYHITLSPFLVKWLGMALGFAIKGFITPLKILGRVLKKQIRCFTIKINTKQRARSIRSIERKRAKEKKKAEEDRGKKQGKDEIQKAKQGSHHGNPSGDASFLRDSFLQDEDTAGQRQQVWGKRKRTAEPNHGRKEKIRRTGRAGDLHTDKKIHRRNRKIKAGAGKSRRDTSEAK